MKILIAGGTGLIGKRLTEMLVKDGHRVHILTRKKPFGKQFYVRYFEWNIQADYIEDGAFEGVDYVFNLAGENIGEKRWTESRKQAIVSSRVRAIELIKKYLSLPNQVKAFVSASAIGFYGGDTGDTHISEESPAGTDFLATCCQQSESACIGMGLRTVIFRLGVVLSNRGGVLPKLQQPIRWGLGAVLGSGRQWVSWIALDDVCRLFLEAINSEQWEGIYNAVAPNPVQHRTMTQHIARQLNRPLWLPPVPAFLLRWILGEMSVLVLGGNYIKNQRIATETDFEYQCETVGEGVGRA